MPPIDGLASYGAATTQVQPRPPQPPAQDRSENTGGFSLQQSLQPGQQAGQSQGVSTQTANGITQPGNSQQASSTTDNSGSVQTLTQFLDRLSNVGSQRQESANQPTTSQPETSQNSALNYSSSGTANPTPNPTEAGRRVSLSV